MSSTERMRRFVRLASFAELVWTLEKLEAQADEQRKLRFPQIGRTLREQMRTVQGELTRRGIVQEQELLADYQPRTA